MPDQANHADVQRALAEHVQAILDKIPVEEIRLSLPVDGGKPRILAEVPAGAEGKAPDHIPVTLDGRSLVIAVETRATHEEVRAY